MDQFTRRIIGFGIQRGTVDGPSLCTVSRGKAVVAAALFGLLQLVALRVSFIPYIASH